MKYTKVVTKTEFYHILRTLASAWTKNNYHTFKCVKRRIRKK